MSVRYVYKLVLPGGEGRRVSLNAQPTWDVLASRVHELFSIPVNDVGLVYVDDDGDEITISSNFELQDYHDNLGRRSPMYATSPRKFIVRNLAVSGARRPPSDSASSSFSFVKHSPAERHPSVSPSRLHKRLSLSPPPHERGRSSSPVLLSESRVIAPEEAEDLIFMHNPPPNNIGLDVEARGLMSPPRFRSLSSQRTRSLSPSFIKMARSPPSDAPRFSESSQHAHLPEMARDYPPTPPLHRSRPVSPYFPSAYLPAASRSASPPIIMAGIRGPSARVNSPAQYLMTEDIMNFIEPIPRPLSNLSRRSLSSPAPTRPVSVTYSYREPSRPPSVMFYNRPGSQASSRVIMRAPSDRSTRPPSAVDFIGQRSPSRCGSPLFPDEFIRCLGNATPEFVECRVVPLRESPSPSVRRSPSVRISRPPSLPGCRDMPSPGSPSPSAMRSPSVRSRSSSVRYVRTPSGSTPEHFARPMSFYSPQSYANGAPVSRPPSEPISRSSSCPRSLRARSPSSSREPIYIQPYIRSQSRGSTIYSERPITINPASRPPSVLSENPSCVLSARPRMSRAPTVISECPLRRSSSSRREPSPFAVRSTRPPSPVCVGFPVAMPSSSRAPSIQAYDEVFPSLATVRNNVVGTTLERLRNVSEGVLTSFTQKMDTLKDEMAESIQQKFEEMKQAALEGGRLSLDHVRTEMDIVKVEARELLEVKEKLKKDVSQLVEEMTSLRWDIDTAKEDLKRLASEVHQEREGMEVQMRDMISQLQKERALRDTERQIEEREKEERTPTRESAYKPFYMSVPQESQFEETEEEAEVGGSRVSTTYNPAYVPLPPKKESVVADVKTEEEEEEEETTHIPGLVPAPRPPVWIRPLNPTQAERRMTWDGHFSAGPVGPLPPPPPPPPPPPRPFVGSYSDAPGTNTNERRFHRHLPRPPTDETNGNGTLSGSDLDGNGDRHGFRSPFVPANLGRANTTGGRFRRWGLQDEHGWADLGWGDFGVPSRYRQHHERGNASVFRTDDEGESGGLDGVRRHAGHRHAHPHPHPHIHVHPPAPFPVTGSFGGLRRMNSVPSRLNGPSRWTHNHHWRHGFTGISENDHAHVTPFEPARVPTPVPAAAAPAPTPVPASAPASRSSFTNGDLSSKSSTERMSSGGTRIERVEVEESRRLYKAKKAAWKKQRDEARKAFMTQTQGQPESVQPSRVRPFDAMTIPAELPNGPASTMPGALPTPAAPPSRASLPPPPPPPLPRFHQHPGAPFSNVRITYPAMPGSLPVPSLQGTPQPQQQGSESRPANARWSVRFAPPPGPGPEHVRPRSVPSPFPQSAVESTDEEPRPALRPVNADVESSDEESRENLPASLPPLGQFPFGFHIQTERQLKNHILNKLSTMGFKPRSGGPFDSIVEKEVRDETARVSGNLQRADVVSIVERLVERLLTNPSFLDGTNSNSRSISPSPSLMAALAAAEARTHTSASGVGTRTGPAPGSIPGQWNGRDL